MVDVPLPHEWQQRPYQKPLWRYLENGGKRAVAVWHRRAGKDDVCLHWACVAAHQRVGNYWHMLPEAAQARKAIWQAINPHTGKRRIDEAFPPILRSTTQEQEMRIAFKCGSAWQVVGSDNYDSLVGAPPVGIVFSEWALADPAAWAYLSPILLENDGWALFVYTPRGQNHGSAFYELAQSEDRWFSQRLKVDDTNIIDPDALAEDRRTKIRLFGADEGEAQFQQEWYCSFESPMFGSYYGKWMMAAEDEGRIGRVPYDPALPVETWWDLGIQDAMAIWFAQRHRMEVRLIDYEEASGEGFQYYAKMLQDKPYVYGRHIAPHDIEVPEMMNEAKSRRELAEGFGVQFEVCPMQSVADGIQAVRTLLPNCWFDRENCSRGIEVMRNYRKKWDEKRRVFMNRPHHDWASHGADAFRYGASMGEQTVVDLAKINPLGNPTAGHASSWMRM